jgi:hypothetical protein
VNVCRGKNIFIALQEDGILNYQKENGHNLFSLGTGHDTFLELGEDKEGKCSGLVLCFTSWTISACLYHQSSAQDGRYESHEELIVSIMQ